MTVFGKPNYLAIRAKPLTEVGQTPLDDALYLAQWPKSQRGA